MLRGGSIAGDHRSSRERVLGDGEHTRGCGSSRRSRWGGGTCHGVVVLHVHLAGVRLRRALAGEAFLVAAELKKKLIGALGDAPGCGEEGGSIERRWGAMDSPKIGVDGGGNGGTTRINASSLGA